MHSCHGNVVYPFDWQPYFDPRSGQLEVHILEVLCADSFKVNY